VVTFVPSTPKEADAARPPGIFCCTKSEFVIETLLRTIEGGPCSHCIVAIVSHVALFNDAVTAATRQIDAISVVISESTKGDAKSICNSARPGRDPCAYFEVLNPQSFNYGIIAVAAGETFIFVSDRVLSVHVEIAELYVIAIPNNAA
jgi:hypothetical protein